MDAFELLVSEILWAEGYWTQTSVKVDLTKEEKREVGRPSAPRWELDVVAYGAKENLLRVVECKSYIDSLGAQLAAFGEQPAKSDRYKLFNDPVLRRVVFNRLKLQLAKDGACREDTEVRLELACGKLSKESDRASLKARFEKGGDYLTSHGSGLVWSEWLERVTRTKCRPWCRSFSSAGRLRNPMVRFNKAAA